MLDAIIKLFTKEISEELERDLDKVVEQVNDINVVDIVKFTLS